MTSTPASASNTATAAPAVPGYENDALRSSSDLSTHTSSTTLIDPNTVQMPGVGRVGLALLVVVGGILLMRAFARKFFMLPGGVKSNKAVRVLSRSMLSPKQHVVLLQVGRRVIVVGDSAGRLSPLSEISDPDEVATLLSQVQNEKSEPIKVGFGKVFGKAADSFESEPEPDTSRELVEAPKESSVSAVAGDELADLGQLLERVRSIQQTLR